jgi:lipopolysaccharide transport system permease protein
MSRLLWTINPWAVGRHFYQYRYLLSQLVRREVAARYRGSWLGPVWSLLTPLLMLAVYTFVFSVVFQSRWGNDHSSDRVGFALAVFVSMTAFGLFGDTITSAPGLIVGNANYVKRIVFPLEILPLARFLANLVQAGFAFGIFLVGLLVFRGGIPWTALLLPVVLLPLALLSLGCGLFLASLGVFVRDVSHVINLVATMLMFMSAVFFPLSCLPPAWQPLFSLNPLVPILENVRRVTLEGMLPHWESWAAVTIAGLVITSLGLMGFLRSKNAFADVL